LLQLGQTGLRLIRLRRVGIFFYNLPVKFRRVRPVVLLLFELRGIVINPSLYRRSRQAAALFQKDHAVESTAVGVTVRMNPDDVL
jgi:hypothetical protein